MLKALLFALFATLPAAAYDGRCVDHCIENSAPSTQGSGHTSNGGSSRPLSSADRHYRRGRAALEAGRWDGAAAAFRAGLREDPDAQGYANLAFVLLKAGREQEYAEAVRTGLRLNSKNKWLRRRMAAVLWDEADASYDDDRFDDAEKSLVEALRYTNDPAFSRRLKNVRRRQGHAAQLKEIEETRREKTKRMRANVERLTPAVTGGLRNSENLVVMDASGKESAFDSAGQLVRLSAKGLAEKKTQEAKDKVKDEIVERTGTKRVEKVHSILKHYVDSILERFEDALACFEQNDLSCMDKILNEGRERDKELKDEVNQAVPDLL